MAATNLGGIFHLGDLTVNRMGFGAMQLAGPNVFGPPQDAVEAAKVLRSAIEAGINHIDTSDFYGPHQTNQLIHETLHPYRDDLVIVTKVGARRDDKGGWLPSFTPDAIRAAVEDNLRNLKLDCLSVVNLRIFSGNKPPAPSNISRQFEALLDLQQQGKIRHIGLSNIVASHLEDALKLGPVVCVQNNYGVLNRANDELVETCAGLGIAFVPFFPLNGFEPLAAQALDAVAEELGASKYQVALAWLLHGTENMLLIPGTSKVAHLKENIAAAELKLTEDQIRKLDAI